jgi:hypothetical protein
MHREINELARALGSALNDHYDLHYGLLWVTMS